MKLLIITSLLLILTASCAQTDAPSCSLKAKSKQCKFLHSLLDFPDLIIELIRVYSAFESTLVRESKFPIKRFLFYKKDEQKQQSEDANNDISWHIGAFCLDNQYVYLLKHEKENLTDAKYKLALTKWSLNDTELVVNINSTTTSLIINARAKDMLIGKSHMGSKSNTSCTFLISNENGMTSDTNYNPVLPSTLNQGAKFLLDAERGLFFVCTSASQSILYQCRNGECIELCVLTLSIPRRGGTWQGKYNIYNRWFAMRDGILAVAEGSNLVHFYLFDQNARKLKCLGTLVLMNLRNDEIGNEIYKVHMGKIHSTIVEKEVILSDKITKQSVSKVTVCVALELYSSVQVHEITFIDDTLVCSECTHLFTFPISQQLLQMHLTEESNMLILLLKNVPIRDNFQHISTVYVDDQLPVVLICMGLIQSDGALNGPKFGLQQELMDKNGKYGLTPDGRYLVFARENKSGDIIEVYDLFDLDKNF